MLKRWDDLPDFMKVEEVRPYWESLNKKRGQLALKRFFDFSFSLLLFIILLIPMIVIAVAIKLDSPGSIFYRQERVTSYGEHFRIHKFRTMIPDAEKLGSSVTTLGDSRITKVGSKLRKVRLDELPQVIDVIMGYMSFVGTRPEAVKYVDKYIPEWRATLLMPAGITSECSIRYKDEEKLLNHTENADNDYLQIVLPEKMKINLETMKCFSFFHDLKTMLHTVAAVFGKDYS